MVRVHTILCVHHILFGTVLTKLVCNSLKRLLGPVGYALMEGALCSEGSWRLT